MVFIMTLVLSVFNGFEQEIHRLLASSGNHITITRANASIPIANHRAVLTSYRAAPVLSRLMKVSYPAISVNGLLGIEDRFEGKRIRALPVPSGGLVSGEAGKIFPRIVHYKREYLDRFDGGNYVLIGRRIARKHGWKPGDRLNLLMPRGGEYFARGSGVSRGSFIIAGFFRTGFLEFDNNIIIMSLKTAQRIMRMGDAVSEIIVQLHNLSHLTRARALVHENIPDNPYLYNISTIREERGNFLAAVNLEKTLMTFVMGLLILAGAAGIWVTVYLLVNDKRQSIGMLRAMGLPLRSINIIFTMSALFIGLFATLIGGSLGIFLTGRLDATIKMVEDAVFVTCRVFSDSCAPFRILPENIYYFDYLPVYPDLNVIFGIGLVTLILSGFAGFFPSRRAALMEPADSIRQEN